MYNENQEKITEEMPELLEWNPAPEDEIFRFDVQSGCVIVDYETRYQLREGTKLPVFDIKKRHYKDRMDDVVFHINYFEKFFDTDHELYVAMMSIKYVIDQKPTFSIKAFQKLILDRLVTPTFIQKIKKMTDFLYRIDVDSQASIKFSNTPKITNAQAKQITATSFAFRMITPICVHFSNNNVYFKEKKDYIEVFDKIFMSIVDRIEENDVPFFYALSRFIAYRCDREYNANRGTWAQKKQLYGATEELQVEEIIHEVVIIKSLHKLDYSRSSVSFIDTIINNFSRNFRRENYKSKPFEIDNEDSQSDSDDYMSHAEQMDMQIYRVDESNGIVSDANAEFVMNQLAKKYPFDIPEEEYEFYYDNVKCNEITYMLLGLFYNKDFENDYAIRCLSQTDTIWLILWMKKWLQMHDLHIIAQYTTAIVFGKFKDNIIKNAKFKEMITSSDTWENVIVPMFKYIQGLYGNLDLILRQFSTLVHSEFVIVDFDKEIDGLRCNDVDMVRIVDEIRMFLIIACA